MKFLSGNDKIYAINLLSVELTTPHATPVPLSNVPQDVRGNVYGVQLRYINFMYHNIYIFSII